MIYGGHSLALTLMIMALFIALFTTKTAIPQVPAPSPTIDSAPIPETKRSPEPLSEADPTKPILWSLRNEYRDLNNGDWANTILLRHDQFIFRNLGLRGGAKGMVLRFDLPLNIVHSGSKTNAGLGDIYAQVLFVPRISRKFAFSLGSGIVLPTATDSSLGTGRMIIAPLAVPLWYMAARKRLVTLRTQHYVSVAGRSSRPDVNYTIVDPFLGIALSRRAWMFSNTEFKWDWRRKMGSAITGVQIGHMISDNMGFWVKPEVTWGRGRQGGFSVKIGLFRFR